VPGAGVPVVVLLLYDPSTDEVISTAVGLLKGAGDGSAWEAAVEVATAFCLDLTDKIYFRLVGLDWWWDAVGHVEAVTVVVGVIERLVVYEGPIGDYAKGRLMCVPRVSPFVSAGSLETLLDTPSAKLSLCASAVVKKLNDRMGRTTAYAEEARHGPRPTGGS
jgi:hypothetical protein